MWHSDAVMQPGPRDGRGSTNGAPTGWLMIALPTVLSTVPKKRIHCCHADYGPAIGMKAPAKVRPDQTQACMHACMSIVSGDRRGPSRANSILRDTGQSFECQITLHSGRVSVNLYRETYARPRSLRNGQQCLAL